MGGVVVYRVNGNVQHSAVVSGFNRVTMAAGTKMWSTEAGLSYTTTVPIKAGWQELGTTIEYWKIKK